MTADRLRINLPALTAMVLFSGTHATGRIALVDFHPLALAGLRFFVAVPLILLILPASDRQLIMRPLPHRWLLLVAALVHASNQFIWATGLQLTTASHSALLSATAPIWAALIAAALGRDRLQSYVLVGAAIALGGVVLLVGRGFGQDGATLLGDGIILLSAITLGLAIVLVGQVVRYYPPLVLVAAVSLVGLIGGVLPTLFALSSSQLATAGASSWLSLLYHATAGFLIAQFLWYRGIGQIGATQAAFYMYLQPVFALVLAAILLGEHLGLTQVAGATVIVLGIAIAQGRLSGLPARLAQRWQTR